MVCEGSAFRSRRKFLQRTRQKGLVRVWLGCLLHAFAIGLAAASCEASPFTVADDIEFIHFVDSNEEGIEPIIYSPDRRYVVVHAERGRLDLNKVESTLRVYSTESLKRVVQDGSANREPAPAWILRKSTFENGPIISNVRWLANSSGFAFLAKTALGTNQLFLADLRTRRLRRITGARDHVTTFDIRDRNHLVYAVLSPAISQRICERRPPEGSTIVATGRFVGNLLDPNLDRGASGPHDRSEIWAIVGGRRFRVEDASSGRPVVLYSEGQHALVLSPDSRSVVTSLAVADVSRQWEEHYPPPPGRKSTYFTAIRARHQDLTAPAGAAYVSQYATIDLTRGRVRPLTDAPTGASAGYWSDVRAAWSADGRFLALSNTFITSNSPTRSGGQNRPCVALADLAGNTLTCLEQLKGYTQSGAEAGYRYVTDVAFDGHDDDRVVVRYFTQPGMIAGTTTYVRSSGGAWAEALAGQATSNQPRFVLSIQQSINDPPLLVFTDMVGHVSRTVWDPNPHLKNFDLGEASAYGWPDKDGGDWIGGLYKPPGYVSGKRYPLVIQTHGLVKDQFIPSGLYTSGYAARELASAGILVIQIPDCPTIFTTEEASCNVAVYERAVKKLVSEGLAEPDRVGITGFSRSDFFTLAALTSGSVHYAAASINDGTDEGYLQYILGSDSAQRTGGDDDGADAESVIGAPPFGEGLKQWFKKSPTFNMDKVSTPLRSVVHGGASGLLYVWEPYAALRYLNKPVDLIAIVSDEHILTNPAARMASQGGAVDWFRFWLQDYEDPDPAKADQYTRWRRLRELQKPNEAAKGTAR
jgi:dipeptidyl aminopeptidase/acylaminoacyl peptidase